MYHPESEVSQNYATIGYSNTLGTERCRKEPLWRRFSSRLIDIPTDIDILKAITAGLNKCRDAVGLPALLRDGADRIRVRYFSEGVLYEVFHYLFDSGAWDFRRC